MSSITLNPHTRIYIKPSIYNTLKVVSRAITAGHKIQSDPVIYAGKLSDHKSNEKQQRTTSNNTAIKDISSIIPPFLSEFKMETPRQLNYKVAQFAIEATISIFLFS